MIKESVNLPHAKAKTFFWIIAICLFLSAGFGGYFGTASFRQEHILQHSSLSRLQALAIRDPDNPRVAYYLSKRLQLDEQTDAAAAELEHAASLSESEDIYLAWASIVPEAQANIILTSYLTRHPSSAAAHFALAQLFQRQNDLSHCYEQAYLASHLGEHSASAWQLYGDSALETNHYSEAESAFRQAISLDPKTVRNHIGLGSALMLMNRRPEGMVFLQQAADLAPQDGSVLAALGSIILQGAETPSEWKTARQYLQQGLRLRPDLVLAQLDLGECSIKEKNWKEALLELTRAQAALPDKPEIFFALAQVYRALGDNRHAIQAIQRYQQLQSYSNERTSLILHTGQIADPEMPLKLARLAVRYSVFQTALAEYKRALAQSPSNLLIKQEMDNVQRRAVTK